LSGGDRGKIKWKLSEVNTRAVSRGQNKLIGKFKMAAGDVISILNHINIIMTEIQNSPLNNIYKHIPINIRPHRKESENSY
jgi:hypothetical protein